MENKLKYFWLLATILLMPMSAMADRLDDILGSVYTPVMITPEQQDSVLNGVEEFVPSALASVGRYTLEYENEQPLYRHSVWADCYVVDRQKNQRWRLSNGPVRDVEISPNGKYIVYAKPDQNLYIYKLDYKVEVPVTHDGYDVYETDRYLGSRVFNGISDWLYEEEFGVTKLYSFSPDSKMLAFVRLTGKSPMTPLFGGTQYAADSVPYVFAGGENPTASVCVYDIASKGTKTVALSGKADCYIPRIGWTNIVESKRYGVVSVSEPELIIQRLSRDQNEMTVFLANAKSTVSHEFYREQSQKYCVNYEHFDEWLWLADNRVIVLSEKSGWRQLYLYGTNGLEQKQLTRDGMDVTSVYGYDEAADLLYFQAAPTPETRQCYALSIKKGTLTQLTRGEGTHSLRLSKDKKRYIECFHSVSQPHTYTLCSAQGKVLEVLEDNAALSNDWQSARYPEKEFFTFKSSNGVELHAWILRPLAHNRKLEVGGRCPVVMTQYSGPASQRVLNSWRKRFEYALADEGYIVVCVDPRGTDCRGTAWRAETYMQLGQKEATDQIELATYMARQKDVDANRIAMIGWSYGGFQVIRTLEEQGIRQQTRNEAALISKGVAIAPVTDWRLYDSAYTERWMRRPEVNEGGYKAADLTTMASDLTGRLLLVHGMADDNVHVTHSMRMAEALIEAGVLFDEQIYPDDNHFLRRGNHYRHLHERILEFLQK